MGAPYRQTADGFELQMATNHLGHFALTGLLLDRIVTTERARVVTVSSHMHRVGRLELDDVAGVTPRNTWVTYGSSKLANLLFTAELARRLTAEGLPTLAVAAHPGWTRSNLAGSGVALGTSRVRRKLGRTAGATLGQSAAAGALPVLCAATSSSVRTGMYVGPARLFRLVGPPRDRPALPSRPGHDRRGRVVVGVGGADGRALLGQRRRLNAAAARLDRTAGLERFDRRGSAVTSQEVGMARRAVRAQHTPQRDDHHRTGTGTAQRGRGALGSGAAHVGVVEQQDASVHR